MIVVEDEKKGLGVFGFGEKDLAGLGAGSVVCGGDGLVGDGEEQRRGSSNPLVKDDLSVGVILT